MRHILAKGKNASDAFNKIVKRQVAKELKTVLNNKSVNAVTLEGLQSLTSFSWQQLLDDMTPHMSTLMSALLGGIAVQTKLSNR